MMNEPTSLEKRRALPWSLASNAANTAFWQLATNPSGFVLFLSELTFSKTQIGFLLSLLPFAGIISPFIAPAVSRFGLKRTLLTFWTLRKSVLAILLLTPLVYSRYGSQTVLLFVAIVITLFAVFRAVAETAYFPWRQEYIPKPIWGRYIATENIVNSLVGFLAVAVAGFIIDQSDDVRRFMVLIAIGVVFGFIAVALATRIPSGAPVGGTDIDSMQQRDVFLTFRDSNFRIYLLGEGLVLFAIWSTFSFLPLYLRDEVGLSSGTVVWLQASSLVGGLLASFIWGWAADRFGAKPITLISLLLMVAVPIFWILIPRFSFLSVYIAIGITVWQGITRMGWFIGSNRFLYVNVIPGEKKTEYGALHYAWVGVIGGISYLAGGHVLDTFEGVTGQVLYIPVDSYTILFIAGLILMIMGLLLLQKVRGDTSVSVGEFASMIFQGNPILAAESLIRFQLARNESSMISTTESLGKTNSPLTIDELVEAINDPRFNVRFEAIVSIARRSPDTRLSASLIKILHGKDPALSVTAAWALGRQRDHSAIPELRKGLNSVYRSIRSHCARSLATLGDNSIAPNLLNRLEQETDIGLQLAYSDALGKLRYEKALPVLFRLLSENNENETRMELSMAVARIIGDEYHFIQIVRQAQTDICITAAKEVGDIRHYLNNHAQISIEQQKTLDDSVEEFLENDIEAGVHLILRLIGILPLTDINDVCVSVLNECWDRMTEFGTIRSEYILLALHAMYTCLRN